MRFEGKLERWHDERGFGFIVPSRGGDPVFVHVSAFARDNRRPKIGETLTFELEAAGDGRKRAVNVQRPPGVRSPQASDHAQRSSARSRSPGVPLTGLAVALVLVAVGAYAWTQFTGRSPRAAAVAPAVSAVPAASSPAPDTPAFRCDGRTYCSQMRSCAEAMFFLKNCPGTKMDGNNDGIPCEKQWCR